MEYVRDQSLPPFFGLLYSRYTAPYLSLLSDSISPLALPDNHTASCLQPQIHQGRFPPPRPLPSRVSYEENFR